MKRLRGTSYELADRLTQKLELFVSSKGYIIRLLVLCYLLGLSYTHGLSIVCVAYVRYCQVSFTF